jgi:DNA invertase Pin-like site-specific DNA recombinase
LRSPKVAVEHKIPGATAPGKCFPDMLGVFAEFERNLRRDRQFEGIARAKAGRLRYMPSGFVI